MWCRITLLYHTAIADAWAKQDNNLLPPPGGVDVQAVDPRVQEEQQEPAQLLQVAIELQPCGLLTLLFILCLLIYYCGPSNGLRSIGPTITVATFWIEVVKFSWLIPPFPSSPGLHFPGGFPQHENFFALLRKAFSLSRLNCLMDISNS